VVFRSGTVEDLVMNPEFWRGRRVLLTGHTGFKGSWLALWLHSLGAKVTGLSLPAMAESLFLSAGVEGKLSHRIGDIRDIAVLRGLFAEAKPEVVFHLAAQSLVRPSYIDPLETFSTNVQGTANVLQSAVECDTVRVIVVVTSDKCYANAERQEGYREGDPLGGDDPYSASKGCAELVTNSWRKSFFNGGKVASARAGNVIGGGDWAADRLIPDLVRALRSGKAAGIRNPASVRPWQHVLEPLFGYLLLAERLWDDVSFAQEWNFGPDEHSVVSVAKIADLAVKLWGGEAAWQQTNEVKPPKETVMLQLNSAKARSKLRWRPSLSIEAALKQTIDWYRAYESHFDVAALSVSQIDEYQRNARRVFFAS
jgi:CDP-glucose 4,6-dehydratase